MIKLNNIRDKIGIKSDIKEDKVRDKLG